MGGMGADALQRWLSGQQGLIAHNFINILSFSVCDKQVRQLLTLLNPFTTGNPFLGTKFVGFSIGRGSGALKGLMLLLSSTGRSPFLAFLQAQEAGWRLNRPTLFFSRKQVSAYAWQIYRPLQSLRRSIITGSVIIRYTWIQRRNGVGVK